MSTLWGAGDYEVLGITVIKPPPMRRTYVPLEPGLSVLYGRNGAGKSRILEAIEAAVRGEQGRTWSWLHIRLRDVPLDDGEGLTAALLKELPSARTRGRPRNNPTPRQQLTDRVANLLRRDWEDWVDDAAELSREIAVAGHLALLPVGEAGGHRWRVFAAALPGEDTPLLNRRASSLNRAWMSALLLEDADEREAALVEAVDDFALGEGVDVDESDPVPFESGTRPELLIELGSLTLSGPLCELYGPPRGDLDQQTLHHLIHLGSSVGRRKVLEPDSQLLHPDIQVDSQQLSERASDLYELVLEGAPRLICAFRPVEDWVIGPPLRWLAVVPTVDVPLPLEELSQAQKRWAEIAIAAALVEADTSGGKALMLLDEPELALHSLAVRTMATGLQSLAEVINVDIVASTHAGSLLESPAAHLLHVLRNFSGETTVHRITGISEDDASLMGLGKADLLQLTRLFVVVEGVHDEIVVQQVCGDELTSARARVIAMRGVTGLPSLMDAQFLLRFSDAHFLIVIDALDPKVVEETWDLAQQTFWTGRNADATWEVLKAALPGKKSAENRFLRELMLSAIVQDQAHRVSFQTLSKPDVVCYLPVSSFTSRSTTWDALLAQHVAEGGTKSFKPWLEPQGFSFTDEDILGAAQALDEVHADLVALANAIHVHSGLPAES